jgi:hypothetical protein
VVTGVVTRGMEHFAAAASAADAQRTAEYEGTVATDATHLLWTTQAGRRSGLAAASRAQWSSERVATARLLAVVRCETFGLDEMLSTI